MDRKTATFRRPVYGRLKKPFAAPPGIFSIAGLRNEILSDVISISIPCSSSLIHFNLQPRASAAAPD